MISSTPIRDIYFPIPTCRCSDCILRPTESHGIYTIGVYKIPSRLGRRGGRMTDAQVSWMLGSRDGLGMGRMTKPFANVQSEDDRFWDI